MYYGYNLICISASSVPIHNFYLLQLFFGDLKIMYVWQSRAEYVWRVVYYWVQCVIVRVTWGARSVHSAAPTSAYKEREDLIYVVERPERMGSLYNVSELRGSIYLIVLPDILYAFIYLING